MLIRKGLTRISFTVTERVMMDNEKVDEILEPVQDAAENFTEEVSEIKDTAAEVKEEVSETAEAAAEQIAETVDEAACDIEAAADSFAEVVETAEASAVNTADEIYEPLPEDRRPSEDAAESSEDGFEDVLESVPVSRHEPSIPKYVPKTYVREEPAPEPAYRKDPADYNGYPPVDDVEPVNSGVKGSVNNAGSGNNNTVLWIIIAVAAALLLAGCCAFAAFMGFIRLIMS